MNLMINAAIHRQDTHTHVHICFVFDEASAVSRHPLLIQSFVESLLGK